MLSVPQVGDPLLGTSQPGSRRMSSDADSKAVANLNTRYLLFITNTITVFVSCGVVKDIDDNIYII